MYDPELYRTKAEVEHWKELDPIATFTTRLLGDGLIDDAGRTGIEGEVAAEMDEAIAFAEAGTYEPVEDLTRFVYSERA
jgi:TPP-dependent pyruvate/acetoin dehydrogenase alpha subunit